MKLAKYIILISIITIILTPCALYIYNTGYRAGQDNMANTWIDGCLKNEIHLNLGMGVTIHCGVVRSL